MLAAMAMLETILLAWTTLSRCLAAILPANLAIIAALQYDKIYAFSGHLL